MKARIFDIKRFAVHDGDGIRTTVFFKGCPLRCVWCHNPEGISFSSELEFNSQRCLGCRECAVVCPLHTFFGGVHEIKREDCVSCGKCVEICPGDCLKIYGQEISPEELLPKLTEDRDFYDNSGGGVTLSGGECLMYPGFCRVLLSELKKEGIHTAVDTCGYVPLESIETVLPFTDVFLYDLKALDEDIHLRCTGGSNKIIFENLMYLDSVGAEVEIRVPFVPGYNDGETEKIAVFLSKLKCVKAVKVLPYHNLAGSKYTALGIKNTLPKRVPTEAELFSARDIMKNHGLTIKE